MKSTGIASTSFKVWFVTFVPSVAAAVTAFTQNTGGSKSAVLGGAGIVSALFASLGKLFHDNGLNKASIAAAGSDIAQALPQLRADLSQTVTFIRQEAPSIGSHLASFEARLAAQEQKVVAAIPDKSAIESVVREILGAAAVAPAPGAAPVTP